MKILYGCVHERTNTIHKVLNAYKEGHHYVFHIKCTECSEPQFKWIVDDQNEKAKKTLETWKAFNI